MISCSGTACPSRGLPVHVPFVGCEAPDRVAGQDCRFYVPCWDPLAEERARDGSATFRSWRAAVSSNKAIWTGGLQAQKRHRKGLQGHYEGAVIDAPWTLHLPKLIVW